MTSNQFLLFLSERGQELYRPMPWREDTRPYYVLVSELMLQQTQVGRVIPKFEAFIGAFPTEKELAAAPLSEVLKLWQGLGYNRRAKYLHDAAKLVVSECGGAFPNTLEGLQKLPGVGKNTAGAITAYSYDQPVVYVETNIRTVYIHHFFSGQGDVDDKQIIQKLTETAPWNEASQRVSELSDESESSKAITGNSPGFGPREFYWALMDYGSWLKANGVRNVARSKHYTKQSKLAGSLRETRGRILSLLTTDSNHSLESLQAAVAMPDRFERALDGLVRDGLVSMSDHKLHLTN